MAHVPGPKKIIKIVGATNLLKKVHFDEMIRFMIVLVNVEHKSGHLKVLRGVHVLAHLIQRQRQGVRLHSR